MSEPRPPRTWRFWIGYWAIPRIALGWLFLAMGWMPAFWVLVGELVPGIAWFIKDEECRALKRSRETRVMAMARMQAENTNLRELAWRRQSGEPVISSICRTVAWSFPVGPDDGVAPTSSDKVSEKDRYGA